VLDRNRQTRSGLVLVDEEHASEQDPLGIEGGISGPVGKDVGGG